ncbi:MAG TPA: hypothetical protein VHB72_04915 [Candidatus Saccharimonadales bacterium]|jgi:hypothetical protein|nr:hypothetical protein [Candidatus Saccharimonadales bacterium]
MNKNSLYIVVALSLAITAATFFITGHDTKRTCALATMGNDAENLVNLNPSAVASSNAPTQATVHGYPFRYYEEPLPANCVASGAAAGGSGFNTAHLAYDLLIWAVVALLLFMPSVLINMWRGGPRMLGDNVRRT